MLEVGRKIGVVVPMGIPKKGSSDLVLSVGSALCRKPFDESVGEIVPRLWAIKIGLAGSIIGC